MDVIALGIDDAFKFKSIHLPLSTSALWSTYSTNASAYTVRPFFRDVDDRNDSDSNKTTFLQYAQMKQSFAFPLSLIQVVIFMQWRVFFANEAEIQMMIYYSNDTFLSKKHQHQRFDFLKSYSTVMSKLIFTLILKYCGQLICDLNANHILIREIMNFDWDSHFHS